MSDLITSPELTIIDGIAFCTSLQVADHFEKRHADVLRDIEVTSTQVLENSEERKSAFTENLFQKAIYTLTNNLGHEVKKPMYLLTRDGFTLLAMSYTGAKAMQFKLAYMEAFNRMETALKYQLPERDTPITYRQYIALRNDIERLAGYAHKSGSAKARLENTLRIRLNVENLNKIPSHRYTEALQIVKQWADDSDDHLLPLLVEITDWWFHHHIAQGAPFTSQMSKEWKAKLQTALPQPLDWKKIHSVLEQLV